MTEVSNLAEWFQLGGIFLGVGALTFVLVSLVMRKPRQDEEALLTDDKDGKSDAGMILGGYTTALADYLPAKANAGDLYNELRSAGYYQPTAVKEYRAVRNLLVLFALLATATVALLVPDRTMFTVLIGGLFFSLLAFSAPRIVIGIRGRIRARAIERGLPLAIDMLILCLSAGQNLLAALLQVARQLRNSNPVLAQELAIAHQHAELHSLSYALNQWAERVRLPEVRNLVMVMVQSEKLGADAVGTLTELATNFRVSARQRAEAQANRTSFWMLFPTVLCFWVASAIILIAPAYLEYFQYRQDSAQMIRDSTKKIQDIVPFDDNPPGQNGKAR